MKRRASEWCWRHPGTTFRLVVLPLVVWGAHYTVMESSLPAGLLTVILFTVGICGITFEA